ncbi:MAG: VOC family protein [Dehalococcoidia bacterium]
MAISLTVYVYSNEFAKLSDFYRRGLGVEPDGQQGNWLPFALPGATFALHAAAPGDEPHAVNYGFGVDDIDATVSRFETAGAKVLRGVADESFGRMATLEDPDGRVFEVVQYGV